MGILSRERVVAGVAATLLATTITTAWVVAGELRKPPEHWFDLFAGPRGAPTSMLAPKVRMGPFPDLRICYALGALAIDALNVEYLDRDFAGRCEPGPLLYLRDFADRAMELLKGRKT